MMGGDAITWLVVAVLVSCGDVTDGVVTFVAVVGIDAGAADDEDGNTAAGSAIIDMGWMGFTSVILYKTNNSLDACTRMRTKTES